MTMLVGQRFPETAPTAGPAKGGAGAQATDTGFSDLLQGVDRQPARSPSQRTDEAGTDRADNGKDGRDAGEGRADSRTMGLSRFDPFHLQAGRKAASDDPSDTMAKDKTGDDDKTTDGSTANPASIVAATGHFVRHDHPSAQAGDRDADSRPKGKGQVDRLDKTALSATSLDGETVAATDGQAQATDKSPAPQNEKSGAKAAGLSNPTAMLDAPSPLSTLAVKMTGARSATPHAPADIETDLTAKPASTDATDDSLQPADDKTQLSRASARVTGRLDRHEDDNGASSSGRFAGRDAAARQDNTVHVVSERSFPAPAAHSAGPTITSLAEVLASARGQATAGASVPHMQGATVAVPAHTMRIELHPAELGTVMASLKLSGDQLSVELKPETAEAYRHLSKESDAIASSLKKLGLDVDTITILQPSIAAPPTARTDAGNHASGLPGRDGSQFQAGTSGGGGSGSGDQHSGGNRGHDGQTLDPAKPAHRERAGGALFI